MSTLVDKSARGEAKAPKVIDCDVHNATRSLADLLPYLERRWHRSLDEVHFRGGHGGTVLGARPHRKAVMGDAESEDIPAGTDLAVMREQLLDRFNVVKAVLSPFIELVSFPTHGAFAGALTRALNDWMIAEWLGEDDRLYGSISVPVEDGQRAAAEIRRVARSEPRMIKVTLPLVTREGLGHPNYWPIYEAADEYGLAVAVHVGGFSGVSLSTGWPNYFLEHHTGYTQSYQSHLASLLVSGTFEAFPHLQFVFEEGGIAWAAPMMWRLDRLWEAMPERAPEVSRRPSEILREHIWLTTQPLDEPELPSYLAEVISQLGLQDRLLFASDYPHWDFDSPGRVLPANRVGNALRQKIFWKNAQALFAVHFHEEEQ